MGKIYDLPSSALTPSISLFPLSLYFSQSNVPHMPTIELQELLSSRRQIGILRRREKVVGPHMELKSNVKFVSHLLLICMKGLPEPKHYPVDTCVAD